MACNKTNPTWARCDVFFYFPFTRVPTDRIHTTAAVCTYLRFVVFTDNKYQRKIIVIFRWASCYNMCMYRTHAYENLPRLRLTHAADVHMYIIRVSLNCQYFPARPTTVPVCCCVRDTVFERHAVTRI